MIFRELAIKGAFLIEPERQVDERGWFARTWDQREFSRRGLSPLLVQCSSSFNLYRGTLRGMHFQAPPFEEPKVVRCTRGGLYDVIVDLRPGSPTFKAWAAAELTAENGRQVYVPEGCAHGFLTLADATEVFYLISEYYSPEHARGVRWNDPAFGITWPEAPRVISPRDQSYPDYEGVGAKGSP